MIWSDHYSKDSAGVLAHRVGSSVLTGQVDFDGDNEFTIWCMDNESKAKAYGGWGHHQTMDRNTPFKVGDYAGQTATNLINLNTLMHQHVIAA